MIKRKAMAVAALRNKRCICFWDVLKAWKAAGDLPTGFFSVLVCGPHSTRKQRIAERFKELWPQCKTEVKAIARFEDMTGYSLVIQTHILVNIVGGFSTNWEHATIVKSRWFEAPRDAHGPKFFYL